MKDMKNVLHKISRKLLIFLIILSTLLYIFMYGINREIILYKKII